MGAWGYGILQNDTAQDGLADLIAGIEADVAALADRPVNERSAARFGAAVGLLFQLSAWYSFDAGNEASATIVAAAGRLAPAFGTLPRPARKLLTAVGRGEGTALAGRPGKIPKRVAGALFATPMNEFPTERVFGKREPSLFAHPQAARYVQGVADRWAAQVDEDMADEEVASDLPGEGFSIGGFGALLVVSPCRLPAKRVERWRKAWRRAISTTAALQRFRRFRYVRRLRFVGSRAR